MLNVKQRGRLTRACNLYQAASIRNNTIRTTYPVNTTLAEQADQECDRLYFTYSRWADLKWVDGNVSDDEMDALVSDKAYAKFCAIAGILKKMVNQ